MARHHAHYIGHINVEAVGFSHIPLRGFAQKKGCPWLPQNLIVYHGFHWFSMAIKMWVHFFIGSSSTNPLPTA